MKSLFFYRAQCYKSSKFLEQSNMNMANYTLVQLTVLCSLLEK